jgi:hypothetical protein
MRLTGVMTRRLTAMLVTAAITLSSVAGAVSTAPAPRPPELPALAPQSLTGIYEDNLDYFEEAAAMAEVDGHHERAKTLRAMSQRDRQFLSVDARGQGRVVEVFGDLERAKRISILVPGSDVSIDTFDGEESSNALGASARTLHARSSEMGRKRIAVIAWLGYETPDTLSPAVLTSGRAEEGAAELRTFVGALRRVSDAPIALMCHSYGSVVCGLAAVGGGGHAKLEAADIVVFGSPGMGVESADDLVDGTRLWAGRGASDWISLVPNESLTIFGTTVGFGNDPTEHSFGALPLNAGDGGHSDHLKPRSAALDRLARIATGDLDRGIAGA